MVEPETQINCPKYAFEQAFPAQPFTELDGARVLYKSAVAPVWEVA